METPHLVTLRELAELLDVDVAALARLERAGLLHRASIDAERRGLYVDRDYSRLRLFLDLLDAGATIAEVRTAAAAHTVEPTAARASLAIVDVVDDVLVRLQTRLDRLRALRADLVATREALFHCHGCHLPVAELPCRSCDVMPARLPRAVDELFCPAEDAGQRVR